MRGSGQGGTLSCLVTPPADSLPDTFPGLELSGGSDVYSLSVGEYGNDLWQTCPTVRGPVQPLSNPLLMPPQDSQFWFDQSDLSWTDGLFDSNFVLPDQDLPSPAQTLTSSMQEYFMRKSRAPSPSLDQASRMWYSAPPNLQDYNPVILETFIRLSQSHVPHSFALFEEALVEDNHTAAYTLALAATGGLFCAVTGSNKVAMSMYNDARRLVLASVSCPHHLRKAE